MPLPIVFAGLALGGIASFVAPKLSKKWNDKSKPSDSDKQSELININNKDEEPSISTKVSTAEAKATHQQRVALSAAALFAVGALTTTPAISVLGLPLLGYGIRYFTSEIWARGLSAILIDVLAVTFTIALGYYFLASIMFAAIFTSSRLIAKGEREAQTDFSRVFGELSDTVWLLHDQSERAMDMNVHSHFSEVDRLANFQFASQEHD